MAPISRTLIFNSSILQTINDETCDIINGFFMTTLEQC